MFVKKIFMLYTIHFLFCFFSQPATAMQPQEASSEPLQNEEISTELYGRIFGEKTDSDIKETLNKLALLSQNYTNEKPDLFLYGSAAFLLYIKKRYGLITETVPADLDFKLIKTQNSIKRLLKQVFNITDNKLDNLTEQILGNHEEDIMEREPETATSSASCIKKTLFESDDKKLSISMSNQKYSKFMVSLYNGNDLQASSDPYPALTIDFTCIEKSKDIGFELLELDKGISFTVLRIEYLIQDAESMKEGMSENKALDKAAFNKWRPRLKGWLDLEKKKQEIENDNTDSQCNGCSTSIISRLKKLLDQEDTRTSCANLAFEPAQDSTQGQIMDATTSPCPDQPEKTVDFLTATLPGLSLQSHSSENETAPHQADKQPMETPDQESARNTHQNNGTKALPTDKTGDSNHPKASGSANQSGKKKKGRYNKKRTPGFSKSALVPPVETNNKDQDKNNNDLLPDTVTTAEPDSSANKKKNKKRRRKQNEQEKQNTENHDMKTTTTLFLPTPLSLPDTKNKEKTQNEEKKKSRDELAKKLRRQISEARTPKEKNCNYKKKTCSIPPRHREQTREEAEELDYVFALHNLSNSTKEINSALTYRKNSKTINCVHCDFSETLEHMNDFKETSSLILLKHFLKNGHYSHLRKDGCLQTMRIVIKNMKFDLAKNLLKEEKILTTELLSPEFADENERINSFNASNLKETIEISKKNKEILAAAGFFYNSKENSTKCHGCDLLIKNIKDICSIHTEEDEEKNKNQLTPWLIHIIHSPFCPFLMEKLSADYIDDIFSSLSINNTQNPLRMTEEKIMSLIKELRLLLEKAKGTNSPKECRVHQHRQTTSPELPPGFVNDPMATHPKSTQKTSKKTPEAEKQALALMAESTEEESTEEGKEMGIIPAQLALEETDTESYYSADSSHYSSLEDNTGHVKSRAETDN